MQERNLAGVFLEIFVVVAILVTLSSVALPRIGEMVGQDSYESYTSAPQPVGCVAGMDLVPPAGSPSFSLTGCYRELLTYACYFTADVALTKVLPLLLKVEGLNREDF